MLAWLNGRAADLLDKLNENRIMQLTSKQKGNLTELQCITAFYAEGCHVSLPYGENSRYDMIVDVDGILLRVQVKTSSLKDGSNDAINFSCRSSHVNSNGVKNVRYTAQEIDYFATFWDGQCYLVPVSECSTEKTLRFAPPKSGQIKGITFASEYVLHKQLKKIRGGSN